MRLAVISDVHGNLGALRPVLNDIDRSGVDLTVCLGDIVGYGPDPEESVELIVRRKIPSVMGNHELALVDPTYLTWFNDLAVKSLRITRKLISEDSLKYFRSLPNTLIIQDCLFVHGCPPDSVLRYIFEPSSQELEQIFQKMEKSVCFVGHTHGLEIYRFDDHQKIRQTALQETRLVLEEGCRYIINVGSVGQPRDGVSKDAKYVIWDTDSYTLEVKFIPYDAAATARKILKRGMPEFHARRLA